MNRIVSPNTKREGQVIDLEVVPGSSPGTDEESQPVASGTVAGPVCASPRRNRLPEAGERNCRILLVDDSPAIHEDFRKVFLPNQSYPDDLAAATARLFGDLPAQKVRPTYEFGSAFQGQEGLELVRRSLKEGHPYALAFVDVRMPPGWDGIETIARMWEVDPDLQVVICTAYSDYGWNEVIDRLGRSDRVVVLKKPFDGIEVLQLAAAFTEKWRLHQQVRTHLVEMEQTVRIRTEALRQSEGRYGSLFENMLEGFAYCRMLFENGQPQDFEYLEVNGVFEKMTGLENVVGRRATEVIPGIKESHPELFETYGRVASTGRPERFEVYFQPLKAWLSVAVYSPERGYFAAVFDNITERKQAEEKLRLQTSALEAAANGIVITDRAGHILWVNPAFTRLTGYSAAEAIGKTPSVLKSGTHDLGFYEAMWKTILGGSVWCGEIVNRRKDGSLYCEEMTITPVLGGNGEVRNFVAIKQDVSQRKEFELALARERDLLRALMENAPDAIYFKDLNSRFLRCSATQAQQFGLKGPEDVVGKSDFDFFTEEHARPAFEDEQEIIRTGRPLVGKAEQEFWKADGKVTWALTTKMPLRNKAGEIIGTFGISKDITAFKEAERDRQSMEVQLRQAQKLEAIGQLAAGIAHEINTPIQFVGDNLRFLQIRFKDFQAALESYGRLLALASQGPLDPQELDAVAKTVAAAELDFLMTETPTSIAQALDGVERVADIVQAMKDFSHPDGDKQPADLGRAIESTSVICRNEWKHVADLKLDLDPKLPLVPCVVGDINQVILNLIVNAAHAIAEKQRTGKRGKGTITVSTQHRDGWCELRVADTGTGIPEALRGRIFDPFFTTKPVGKGTGQGLFLAHNVIAEKHQGTLAFETELGAGTTFIIRLPLDPRAGEPSNAA